MAIEQPGPWQSHALQPGNSRLSEKISNIVGAWPEVTVVLIRSRHRHGAKTRRLFVANVLPEQRWLMSAELTSVEQVLNLEPANIVKGIKPVWLVERINPVTLICTNGKRDICCALEGRRLLNLLESQGEVAWESTHLGGHRFAPSRLTLPDGRMYGGTDGASYRGASGLSRIQQAAECKAVELYGYKDFICAEPEPIAPDQWSVRLSREGLSTGFTVQHRTRGLAVESCGKSPVLGDEYLAF
ncbi:MAG TPA: sucrase ferredoxin [Candidatus Nanopelagicaceae bacterium]|nr:sucrase ferredoxin [Candidatus Nanopelagicaceae bacterium]